MTHDILDERPNESSSEIADEKLPNHEPQPGRSRRRIGLITGAVLLLATAGFFGTRLNVAKPDQADRNSKQQITPVTVASVTQKTVPVQIQAIGNVQAASTVSVTPQASGRITGVFFQKGQDIQKGQLLFTLDNRTQLAAIQQARGTIAKDQAQVQQARATLDRDLTAVKQAEATLAKDQAQAELAQDQSQRYGSLYNQGAVSLDQAQQYNASNKVSAATLQADQQAIASAQNVVKGDQAAIANAEAVLSADQAVLQNAEVELSYTKIYAPIDGRAGDILVTEGNVVQANSTNALVTIAKIRPIQVSFSVPESNLPEIQKHVQNGKLNVSVNFPNSNRPIQGVLNFVNNTVDTTTGTIQLIGQFDNAEGQLFPGQFVNTTLTLTQQPNATVVPSQAVQNGPNGQFIFVVKPDMTVENVPVTASSTISGLSVIQKGSLKPGDKVVTDGQANLVAGGKVRVKTAAEAGGNANSGSAPNNGTNPTSRRKQRSQPSNPSNSGNGGQSQPGGNS
jgi:multidrug efflux system membrane fusion protein